MPGPSPKPAEMRQRRNRTTTAAHLLTGERRRRPPALPRDREWRTETRNWWRDVWRSPMAGEYLQADIHGLYILADLVDRYWDKPSTMLAAEIRQHRQCFGLTPIDRRRLQWEVQRVEGTEPGRPPVQRPADDPHQTLRALR